MRAKRAELLQDLSMHLELDARRCLDAADYLARHARDFGIRADLELRRNHSGRLGDRHYVLCHSAGGVLGVGGPSTTKPLWIMHLIVSPGAGTDRRPDTLVTIGLQTYRRWGRGVEAGRAAQQYRTLLEEGLRHAAASVATGRRRHDNVVALRPYADLPPVRFG